MGFKDLRDYVNYLRKHRQLLDVDQPLSPRFEVGAALRYLDQRSPNAVYFSNVTGFSCPVVGNLLGSYDRIALALPRDGGRPLFFAGMIYLRSPFLPTGPSLGKNLGADPSSLQPLPRFPCNNQGSIPQLVYIFRPQHEHNLAKLFFQCF